MSQASSFININIDNVIDNGACIGCGNCAAYSPDTFSMVETEFGLIQARRIEKNGNNREGEGMVCPFSNSDKNEDYFNSRYQVEANSYDDGVGFYRNVYAGFVNEPANRLASSSGGLVTYLLERLLERKMVTGAVVVSSVKGSAGRLQYSLVRSIDELRAARKSKYHMVSHDNVVKEIISTGESDKFIYVGIPCGVKSIKLLSEEMPELKNKIKYTAAIFCGHQKSHAFTEYVAWQMGVSPVELRDIDYRLKKPTNDASKYYYEVKSDVKNVDARVDSLKWMDWGLGLFKPKACDFCDDVAGESADIIFGDAWHRKYARDYRGTNLVLTRVKELEDILVKGKNSGDIILNDEDISFIYATQGGNFRHRQEGLLSRLKHYEQISEWSPNKNPARLMKYKYNSKRDSVYVLRHKISMMSHSLFLDSKSRGDLSYFWKSLSPEVDRYYDISTSHFSKLKSFVKGLLLRYFNKSSA